MKVQKWQEQMVTWRDGDYFAIELLDGSYTVGQSLYLAKPAYWSISSLYFGGNFSTIQEIRENLFYLTKELIIAALQVTSCDLMGYKSKKQWEVVGHGEIKYLDEYFGNVENIRADKDIKVIGCDVLKDFLNAYYGLYPWNGFFDTMLISPDKKPSSKILKYKDDFIEQSDGNFVLKDKK